MDAAVVLFAVLCFAEPSVKDQVVVGDRNFVVTAPTREFANEILLIANAARTEIARDWVGSDAAERIPRSGIEVTVDRQQQWAGLQIRGEKDQRVFTIVLSTDEVATAHASLRHEVAHLILHSIFDDRLPAWADEGVACSEDSKNVVKTLRRTTSWYPLTGKWPKLGSVLNRKKIEATDYQEYALSWSLTQFFLDRGSKEKLLKFAVEGKATNWNTVLRKYYSISNEKELQELWQEWVRATTSDPTTELTGLRQ